VAETPNVLPWLLVTTTNVARNSGRAAFRYRRLLSSLPRAEVVSEATSDQHLQDQIDGDAARALGTLDALDLQLVSLVVFEEYTMAAAARIIPSLSEPQKDTDKIPATVNPELFSHMLVQDASGSRDVDPTNTRRVGQTETLTTTPPPRATT
jgi:hypothetical protein